MGDVRCVEPVPVWWRREGIGEEKEGKPVFKKTKEIRYSRKWHVLAVTAAVQVFCYPLFCACSQVC